MPGVNLESIVIFKPFDTILDNSVGKLVYSPGKLLQQSIILNACQQPFVGHVYQKKMIAIENMIHVSSTP